MRPRTVAVLFLVVAGLLAFIWFYERDLPSSDERTELAKRVLRLEADEVRGLTLARGETAVRLERVERAGAADEAGEGAAAEWRLRQPLAALADRYAVESLVDRLVGLEKERTLEEPDRAALGLAEPRGRVTLETADGPLELVVGSEVPASSTMILGVAGRDEAYVVADSLWRDLEKPAGDWRSKELGPESREEIQRISLAGGAVALGRRGETFWVESPYVDKADRDLVNDLLGEITGLTAESFVDEPPEPMPELAGGSLEVVLEGREEALRVELGEPVGGEGDLRLARVGGQLVELRGDLAEALARPAAEWRSPAWAALEAYQIDRLTARDPAGETVFQRDGGEWLRDGVRVEYEPVSDLLYALTGIEAESVSSAPGELAEPRLTFELAGEEGEAGETLRLYPADDAGTSPATVEGRDVLLLLAEGAVADLELKLAEARAAAEPSADEAELEPLRED